MRRWRRFSGEHLTNDRVRPAAVAVVSPRVGQVQPRCIASTRSRADLAGLALFLLGSVFGSRGSPGSPEERQAKDHGKEPAKSELLILEPRIGKRLLSRTRGLGGGRFGRRSCRWWCCQRRALYLREDNGGILVLDLIAVFVATDSAGFVLER